MNNEELKSNLLSSKHWLRLLFMVLFAALFQVATIVVWVLVILQFLFSLVTGNDNKNLRSFGDALSAYIAQTLRFLTYVSDEKPFPFSDWPTATVDNKVVVETAPVASTLSPVLSEPADEADTDKRHR